VVTGPTGIGKTSLLSQISLDFAKKVLQSTAVHFIVLASCSVPIRVRVRVSVRVTVYDLLKGVNTLWGSFEIKNSRLAKKMLQQVFLLSLSHPLTITIP
jgi:hypothetical protein